MVRCYSQFRKELRTHVYQHDQPSLITLPAPTQQSIAQGRKQNREKSGTIFYCPLDKERAISTIFGGLRPTEAQKAEWQDITFESKEVFVKNHRKTSSRRFILRNADGLWVWLTHIKTKYPNEPLNPTGNHNTFERKVRREFGGWIQDGLRHSFGTYYHSHTHDIAHVVYVMGNSIKIAKKHYVREVTKEWNDKFWSLKPTA